MTKVEKAMARIMQRNAVAYNPRSIAPAGGASVLVDAAMAGMMNPHPEDPAEIRYGEFTIRYAQGSYHVYMRGLWFPPGGYSYNSYTTHMDAIADIDRYHPLMRGSRRMKSIRNPAMAWMNRNVPGKKVPKDAKKARAILASGPRWNPTANNPPLLTIWPNPGWAPETPLSVSASARANPMEDQYVETYKGYPIYYGRSSYSCPSLNLWGYYNDLQIRRAISREINKRKKKVKKNPARKPAQKNVPFRNGQKIAISDFEAWLSVQAPKIKASYRKAMKQYVKFHLGTKPTSVSFQMLDIGGPGILPPEVMYSAGLSPAETYTPGKSSKKSPNSYVHDYKTQPQVIVGGKKGRQFVLKPLTGGARVDDWFRG